MAKNAYDADATEAVVRLDLASGGEPTITVTDDGGRHVTRSASAGLAGTRRRSIGADSAGKGRLSAKHHGLPLGENGLGFLVDAGAGRAGHFMTSKDFSPSVLVIPQVPENADAPGHVARPPAPFCGRTTWPVRDASVSGSATPAFPRATCVWSPRRARRELRGATSSRRTLSVIRGLAQSCRTDELHSRLEVVLTQA